MQRHLAADFSLPGKKGIGLVADDRIESLRPRWNYNWSPIRPSSQSDDVEFIPMIWGGSSISTLQQKLESYVQPAIASGHVKRVLGFNEPDSELQANMQVADAVELWESMATNITVPLISPSCVHADGEWMQEFMEYDQGRSEWIGVHWYGSANVAAFQSDLKSYYELYQRPLLVTEFAPADWTATYPSENQFSQSEVLAFMKKVLPWLEQQDFIAGYAWFSFPVDNPAGTSSALFDSSGDLTDCGLYYASVNATNPYGDQSIGSAYDNITYYAACSIVLFTMMILLATRQRMRPAVAPLQQELIAKHRTRGENSDTNQHSTSG